MSELFDADGRQRRLPYRTWSQCLSLVDSTCVWMRDSLFQYCDIMY